MTKTTETPKERYAKSLKKFQKQMSFQKFNKKEAMMAEPEDQIYYEEIPSDEIYYGSTTISYTTGSYVGDPYDEYFGADGPVVAAISPQEEEETRVSLQGQINEAKTYLNSHGLDFSDVYASDDYQYIHAANLVMEMEDVMGIPSGGGGPIVLEAVRENTTFGCITQAIGINALYDAWFDKFATKRMLIAAVGKLATRYLGWVGAAVAVYDFIDCMWG